MTLLRTSLRAIGIGREQRASPPSISNFTDLSVAMADYGYPLNTFEQTLADGSVVQATDAAYTTNVARGHTNSIIHSLVKKRMETFSMVAFAYQVPSRRGSPSELSFNHRQLAMLRKPWPGGTTQDLMATSLLDVDYQGNSYWTKLSTIVKAAERARFPLTQEMSGPEQLVRLRPDWVRIILGQPVPGTYVPLGFVYSPNGRFDDKRLLTFTVSEVAHFMPLPDPIAPWRGMSWVTPVIREILADDMMNIHRHRTFVNGGTPNMIVKFPKEQSLASVRAWMRDFGREFSGVENAGKPVGAGGGVDIEVVGNSLRDLDFSAVQKLGETRMAAAAGVPPIVAGFSEGLNNSSYANYNLARRAFADGVLHPLWANFAGSMETLFAAPPQLNGARLWYDSSVNPFLREDTRDAAQILQLNASTMSTLVQAGYTADSVQRAVISGDLSLLKHSGLFSVQLQAPGSNNPTSASAAPELPAPDVNVTQVDTEPMRSINYVDLIIDDVENANELPTSEALRMIGGNDGN